MAFVSHWAIKFMWHTRPKSCCLFIDILISYDPEYITALLWQHLKTFRSLLTSSLNTCWYMRRINNPEATWCEVRGVNTLPQLHSFDINPRKRNKMAVVVKPDVWLLPAALCWWPGRRWTRRTARWTPWTGWSCTGRHCQGTTTDTHGRPARAPSELIAEWNVMPLMHTWMENGFSKTLCVSCLLCG